MQTNESWGLLQKMLCIIQLSQTRSRPEKSTQCGGYQCLYCSWLALYGYIKWWWTICIDLHHTYHTYFRVHLLAVLLVRISESNQLFSKFGHQVLIWTLLLIYWCFTIVYVIPVDTCSTFVGPSIILLQPHVDGFLASDQWCFLSPFLRLCLAIKWHLRDVGMLQ